MSPPAIPPHPCYGSPRPLTHKGIYPLVTNAPLLTGGTVEVGGPLVTTVGHTLDLRWSCVFPFRSVHADPVLFSCLSFYNGLLGPRRRSARPHTRFCLPLSPYLPLVARVSFRSDTFLRRRPLGLRCPTGPPPDLRHHPGNPSRGHMSPLVYGHPCRTPRWRFMSMGKETESSSATRRSRVDQLKVLSDKRRSGLFKDSFDRWVPRP